MLPRDPRPWKLSDVLYRIEFGTVRAASLPRPGQVGPLMRLGTPRRWQEKVEQQFGERSRCRSVAPRSRSSVRRAGTSGVVTNAGPASVLSRSCPSAAKRRLLAQAQLSGRNQIEMRRGRPAAGLEATSDKLRPTANLGM
jgi:hypothetical protein